MRMGFVLTLLFVVGLVFPIKLYASDLSISVDTLTNLIDGNVAPFNQLMPGDTVQFEPGRHDYILIRNFTGAAGEPIVFINKKGPITMDTDHYFGISIQSCRFIRLTGTGDEASFYGFKISRVQNGAGIGVGALSSDVEIDHVSIEHTLIAGIYAKTDPDCAHTSTRESFVQYHTVIHDNYIAYAGNEGMYVGSTKYFGQHIFCNDVDSLLLPSLLDGVRIYNNIIKYSGWDGIQVSSASTDCQIYDNLVLYDSQAEVYSQMSGIILGGGSKCDCYNNYISNGKGNGIESHGLGGYRIFNNIIVDAGRSFQPLDTSLMKYGIYVTDISVQADSAFYIMHNDIISPKSDGIRFTSVLSKGSLIASNVVINPGTYDYYEHIHTSFTGEDSYVMLPNSTSDVLIRNNYFARNADSARFSGSSFTLNENSPLIDAAYPDVRKIQFDAYRNPRIYGPSPDIGAYEFNPVYLNIQSEGKEKVLMPLLFPNPVKTRLTIRYYSGDEGKSTLTIYDQHGNRLMSKVQDSRVGAELEININVEQLAAGLYIYQLNAGKHSVTGKFIKAS